MQHRISGGGATGGEGGGGAGETKGSSPATGLVQAEDPDSGDTTRMMTSLILCAVAPPPGSSDYNSPVTGDEGERWRVDMGRCETSRGGSCHAPGPTPGPIGCVG